MTLKLFPPLNPYLCKECGVDHDPELPHDACQLCYQYYIYQREGRWGTWADAMAHCDEETKKIWTEEIRLMGIDPESAQVLP